MASIVSSSFTNQYLERMIHQRDSIQNEIASLDTQSDEILQEYETSIAAIDVESKKYDILRPEIEDLESKLALKRKRELVVATKFDKLKALDAKKKQLPVLLSEHEMIVDAVTGVESSEGKYFFSFARNAVAANAKGAG